MVEGSRIEALSRVVFAIELQRLLCFTSSASPSEAIAYRRCGFRAVCISLASAASAPPTRSIAWRFCPFVV